MRIPKKFSIAGIEVEVINKRGMFTEHKCVGMNIYKDQAMYIDFGAAPSDTLFQTFLHEKVHWILFIMNEKLVNDERFVDLFAHLLHQTESSAIHIDDWHKE